MIKLIAQTMATIWIAASLIKKFYLFLAGDLNLMLAIKHIFFSVIDLICKS